MPTGANLPSLRWAPVVRLKLAYARFKTHVKDYFLVLVAKWTVIKPRPKLHTQKIPAVAKALHERMGHAFASGDETEINETCASGLAESLTSRLQHRAKGEKWRWTVHRYKGRAKVVSHKAATLPISQDSTAVIRQAVVRIRSLQSLSKRGEHAVPRDMTEYVVLQKLYGFKAKDEWKIWGTIEEDKNLWKQYL